MEIWKCAQLYNAKTVQVFLWTQKTNSIQPVCFVGRYTPSTAGGIHYLVSMNNVRRITFVLRKKKCIFLLLLLHSVSSSRFDSTQRPAFPIERFKQKPHVHLKVNFISNSSSNFLEVRPNCGNQTDLKIIATLFFFFSFPAWGAAMVVLMLVCV